jgi:hypothetical protein
VVVSLDIPIRGDISRFFSGHACGVFLAGALLSVAFFFALTLSTPIPEEVPRSEPSSSPPRRVPRTTPAVFDAEAFPSHDY